MSNIKTSKALIHNNHARQWLVILITGLLLTACGGNVGGVYVESREAPPLRVPEKLDRPSNEAALIIPGVAAPELAGLRDDAVPPKVLTSEEAALSSTRVGFGEGALFLLVEDRVESVYRRLGFTLNRSGLSLQERKPDSHAYVFLYRQPPPSRAKKGFWRTLAFWKSAEWEDYSGHYEVRLVADDDNPLHTRVYLYDANGKAAQPAPVEQLLGIVQERLG